jgi:hypothetical protein
MDYDLNVAKLYAPIPVGLAQSRLLRLHRVPAAGPLLADLVVVDVKSEGALLYEEQRQVGYTALSYTWGTGPFSHNIIINGVSWRIKESLSDFLHQYRSNQSLERESYLWIDAVVINQADADEKSRQVANMIDIYDKARHVQVWLGKATMHTEEAVGFLHHLLADTHRKNKNISASALEGLRDLYNRTWPTRMWIRQEVWAARAISIQCGSFILPLDVFKAGVVFSQEAGDNLTEGGSEVSDLGIYSSPRTLVWLHNKLGIGEAQLAAISFLTQKLVGQQSSEDRAASGLGYKAMEGDGRKDILWLLYESVNYESTDIRDRIYALIGMCDDPDIEINYHKTPDEVFTSFATHIILRARSLGCVLDQSCKYGRQSDLDLPSWVPDWRTLNLVRYEPETVTTYDMNSSFDSNKPRVLAIHGFLLGTVEVAKTKKKRALNKFVHIDWTRIHDTLEESNLLPGFQAKLPREDTIIFDHMRREMEPGDRLIAACGSDHLLLLRSHSESEDDKYDFVSCVFSDSDRRKKLCALLLEYGIENGRLETFAVF